ncbi:hypothetical protein ALC62_03630 [Cyphomyrmex costatus]|uniref:Odorant receptor n=1 Tax=Cyphomyrmex costatus TaxID=456900 RepID=A0A195CXG3_9HYME|nr:hypothetical protein ALC62_03630 [Cyphomyrmex costatus]
MQDLIERVRFDWNELSNAHELEIIKKYSAIGRLITLFTTLFAYLAIFSFILVQLLLNFVLDIATTTNESRIRHLTAEIEVFIDQQKYFTPLLLYMFLVVLCGITTVIAMETLCMSYTQHACGLFEIAKFIEMTKANFEWMYFIAIPCAVLTLSINLYRLSRLITTEAYGDLITTVLFVLGHIWYLFFCNYVGQEVINHSSDIFHKTYNVQWYMTSLKVQKLLLFIMQRTTRYCTLMVGGLFIPSLEGFATVQDLMKRIICDWNELNNLREIEIIKKYANIGRFITIITTLFIYISIFCFILIQYLSNFFFNITFDKNESHPRQLPVLIECFMDQQKNFCLILIIMCLAVVCGFTTVVATETIHMSYTHHACGLFEIASYRIEQTLLKDTIQNIASSSERSSIICRGVISGFNMYKKAIEFVIIICMIHTIKNFFLLCIVIFL